MSQSNSGNLSKGDVISFVALLLLGLVVFFGLNFTMLGNRLPSAMVAVLLFMLMVVFVFLAAYAKAQDFTDQHILIQRGVDAVDDALPVADVPELIGGHQLQF